MYLIKENSLSIFDKPKDWEYFSEADLKNYLSAGLTVFKERLEKVFYGEEVVTAKDEKELKFMLEALIDAKKMLKK